EVVGFVQATLFNGYQAHFPDQLDEVRALIDRAMQALVSSQANGPHPAGLADATSQVLEDVFHKSDPNFWFNQAYHQYKTVTKPQQDLALLRTILRGRRVLDYGCGSGYLAASLARQGYQVFTTDVLDYRYPEARHLPFVKMEQATELAYPADSIDSVLVLAVLHHIDTPDLVKILANLGRVARWLVIKEDSYGLPAHLPELAQMLAQQPLLARFQRFSLADQFLTLALIDYFANAVAQGLPEMHMPFQFRTVEHWQLLLAEHGWPVIETRLAGFEPGRMHQSCHVWLVCERNPQTDSQNSV
ncbi:MAG: class I SAM-dependent methyltransferase, partial [Anaerolineales bacterium]|nr:class I SAM-dependent methyltransferase [Anaerolineales bacterium]